MDTPLAATLEDVPSIWRLIQRCTAQLNQHSIYQWDNTYPTLAILEEDIAFGHAYLVRGAHGMAAAYFALSPKADDGYAYRIDWYAPPPSFWMLHRLCVHPGCQRQGWARALISLAERTTKALGIPCLMLTVFEENTPALRIYQSLGYRPCGQMTFEPHGPLAYTLYKPL